MHTVEVYECAKRVARSLGYEIREEELGGVGGGACEVAGNKYLFVDLAMSPVEQLELVTQVLDCDPNIMRVGVPLEVARRFPSRRAA